MVHVTPRTSGPGSTLVLGATIMLTEAEVGGCHPDLQRLRVRRRARRPQRRRPRRRRHRRAGVGERRGRRVRGPEPIERCPERGCDPHPPAGHRRAHRHQRARRQLRPGARHRRDQHGRGMAGHRRAGRGHRGGPDAGAVTIVPKGTDTARDVSYYQGKSGLPGHAEYRDLFGYSLSTFAGTGLAVGAPNETVNEVDRAGQVTGLRALAGQAARHRASHQLLPGVAGVPGTDEVEDGFGASLAPRGSAALTIGVPGEDVTVSAAPTSIPAASSTSRPREARSPRRPGTRAREACWGARRTTTCSASRSSAPPAGRSPSGCPAATSTAPPSGTPGCSDPPGRHRWDAGAPTGTR